MTYENLGMLQKWGIDALRQLSANDPDSATILNGVGFSKLDGDFGKSLLTQFEHGRRLSQKQWACVLRLANKYKRQVGAAPEEFTFPAL